MNKRNRGSSEGAKHPYLRLAFWNNPANQFWERDTYSEETKQMFRDILQKWNESEKNLAIIQPNLK